ncbi:MAG: glycosyltransferase family 2 protein [Actinobacteria bacterium]|nr:glycosyltransferase family 2 protein [Actinomycetota bacterium]
METETSVILVTYNSASTISKCLESLFKQDDDSFEVLIVDSCSSDDTVSKLGEYKDKIRLFLPGKNLGYSGGNNLAARYAKGKYLIFLNPDVIVKENWLKEMILPVSGDDTVGVVGCLIYYPDGETIHHAGGLFLSNAITKHMGDGERELELSNDGYLYPQFVTGASILVRKVLFERLGGFDVGYFPGYFEEAELCSRVRQLGMKVLLTPRAKAIHFESSSTGKFSQRFYYYYHKNRIRFVIKNFSPAGFFRKFIPAESRWLSNGRTVDQNIPLIKSYIWNFFFLPCTMISKLRNILQVRSFNRVNTPVRSRDI